MTKRKNKSFRAQASNRPLQPRKALTMNYGNVKSRSFQLKPNSIIAFLHPKYMSQTEFSDFLEAAVKDVIARFGMNTIVVGLEHWNEMRILEQDEMNYYDWYHKDQILMLKKDFDLSKHSPEEIEEFVTRYMTGDEEE